jgi:hypothetical protein
MNCFCQTYRRLGNGQMLNHRRGGRKRARWFEHKRAINKSTRGDRVRRSFPSKLRRREGAQNAFPEHPVRISGRDPRENNGCMTVRLLVECGAEG